MPYFNIHNPLYSNLKTTCRDRHHAFTSVLPINLKRSLLARWTDQLYYSSQGENLHQRRIGAIDLPLFQLDPL